MKATRETQDLKEELQKKEQIRQAAKKREEKAADLEAKRKIKEQIEADKRERQRKAEEAKALREGRSLPTQAGSSSSAPTAAPTKPKTNANEARLKLQTSQGALTKTLPADTTLFEVAQMIEQEQGIAVTSFSINFPRKTFTGSVDFSKTLKEAGWVPSAAVNVQ
jgi:UBX domain-containing protein 1/4